MIRLSEARSGILALFFLLLWLLSSAYSQFASTVRVTQAEDDQIVVTYDLLGESYQTFEISLLLSRDGGQNFDITPRTVSGDVGENVKPGRGKKIVWDVLMDVPRLQGSAFVFRVTAVTKQEAVTAVSKQGASFTGTSGIQWVFIAGGSFEMGDTFGDGGSDEKPVHTVTLSGFYLSKHEITVSQFREFCRSTGRTMPDPPEWNPDPPGWDPGPPERNKENHPVVNVTWDDARAFSKWVGGRLPTEAEWEYAAREGGKRVKFGTGKNELNPRDANYNSQDGYEYTSSVGSFAPNALGLYDMAGNVWEWCQDWYDESYYPNSPQMNPRGPSSGQSRVLRGGSWCYGPQYVRCADRDRYVPTSRYNYVGFRCAQDVR